MAFQPCFSRSWAGVMVVVPAFAERQYCNPPDVDAIVCGGEGFISKSGNVAQNIEHQRHLKHCNRRQQTGKRRDPAEDQKNGQAERQT